MQSAIRTEHLGKTFRVGFWGRKVKAVEDLSLEVGEGEIFGLLGPNGAGKTTAIKMLLGFVRPTTGRAFVAGEPAGSLAARRTMGYLPENPALYEFLTGEEYLRFAGRLAGLSRADAATRTQKLLEQVGLAGRADRPIRRFSKGMVQRLGLAQALIGEPDQLADRLAGEGAQVLRRDGAVVLTFPSEAPAQAAVRAIVGAGGVLVSLAPHRQTLESLFVQRARDGAAPAA